MFLHNSDEYVTFTERMKRMKREKDAKAGKSLNESQEDLNEKGPPLRR